MFASMTTARRSSTLRAAVACPNALTLIVSPKHVEQPQTITSKWYGLGGSRQDFVLSEAVTT